MMDKYRARPDFVRPDPTPADRFCWLDTPTNEAEYRRTLNEAFAEWEADGIEQLRVTITGPDVEGDHTGYPAGIWLEGWKDRRAVQLPFGASYPEGGPIYPPLTTKDTEHAG